MRATQILIPTIRENPADAEITSHRLMLRAGLIRQIAAGLYTWLPFGLRVIRKIESIIREELNAAGAQELLMPVVQPAELWMETERWEKMGPAMMRMQDRHDRDFCLGPTHEEVITDLFRGEVHSYKQLPLNFYQIQTKFRDETRPRFGVIRSREFTMKDGYSFDVDQASFDKTYQGMHDAYTRIFSRLNLDFRAVDADTGDIGGANSHEFQVLANSGEDTVVYSDGSDYAANLEKAVSLPPTSGAGEATLSLEKVATPGQHTIDALIKFLDCQADQTVKTLIVEGEDGPVALILRGDHQLNEIKAAHLDVVKSPLTFTSDEEITRVCGSQPGSIGPIGLSIPIVVDRAAAAMTHFVCGANEDNHHFVGGHWQRDIGEIKNDDLRNVEINDPSPDGQGNLQFARGIEVGHIFQLGTTYTTSMRATVLDENGKSLAPIMGCYGIGVTRLVAAIIEQNHDAKGICWPISSAPFAVHIIALNYPASELVKQAADQLYENCKDQGLEVLLDDRAERPGVKFAEADLIGLPIRITVGERGLKDGMVEVKSRNSDEMELVALDTIMEKIVGVFA